VTAITQFASEAVSRLRLRGRSLMALVLTPEFPMAAWFAGLDEQMRASALLLDRPIIVDLSQALAADGCEGLEIVLEGLEGRGLRLVAVEGAPEGLLAGTRWAALARDPGSARPTRELPASRPDALEPRSDTPRPSNLTIVRPVRSGQSIVFEPGDVTIVGAVASGAEVIAGGSIHVYGALRGRAIAGLRTGETARIFCRRLEAELVGVGTHYRTAENWGAGLHGQPAQAWCDRGALRLSAFD
jgi:septum site-determining protein MinC